MFFWFFFTTLNKIRIKIQNYLIKKFIHKLIFIDEDVKKTLKIPKLTKQVKLYNSFNIQKKVEKKFGPDLNIGFVGNFTNSKGVELLINLITKLRFNKKIFFILLDQYQLNLIYLRDF